MRSSLKASASACVLALTLTSTLVAPTRARADSPEAKALFDAGVQAYQVGDFKAAIQAFEQAHKVEARPGLIFSIAQAHRRQYVIDGRAGHVAAAIKYFREYLAQVEQGGRRPDAVAALGELEPTALRLEIEGKLQPLDDGEPVTRLVVSTAAEGATIRIDGKEPKPMPFTGELAPGKHTVVVRADGFAEERREIQVAKGGVTALDLPLKGLPGLVTLRGPGGAQLSVDGRVAGTLPLGRPLEVDAGVRQLRLTLNGHESWSETLRIGRDGQAKLDARMPWTPQRKAAVGLLGGSGGLLVAGALTGTFSLLAQASAADSRSKMDAGQVICRTPACPELDRYNDSIRTRDALGGASLGLLGAALLTGAGGLLLFVLDAPSPARSTPDEGPVPRPAKPPLEVGVGPAGMVGRFW